MDIIGLRHGIMIIVLGLWIYYSVYGSFWVILHDSDCDILAIVIAGVASAVGGLCFLSYHARMMFGEFLGLVWGFIASRGAIPILNSEIFMVLLAIKCNRLIT